VKNQSELVQDVLRIMAKAKILDNVLVIGSWCAHLYTIYFTDQDYIPRIRTRDIDFLTKTRPSFPKEVDFEELLSPLGFEVEFFGKGYMKLESEELMLEFLTPEVGRPTEKPVPLVELKFNAQPLRHLSILWRDPIQVSLDDINIHLPHPADYMLQKLLSSSNRKNNDKAAKDREMSFEVFRALLQKDEKQVILSSFNNLSKAEKKIVKELLKNSEYFSVFEEIIRK